MDPKLDLQAVCFYGGISEKYASLVKNKSQGCDTHSTKNSLKSCAINTVSQAARHIDDIILHGRSFMSSLRTGVVRRCVRYTKVLMLTAALHVPLLSGGSGLQAKPSGRPQQLQKILVDSSRLCCN